MADLNAKADALLNQPLNIFTLPAELLTDLVLHHDQAPPPAPEPVAALPVASLKPADGPDDAAPALLTCLTCGMDFGIDVEKQRVHYRLDWHRFNVKRRLANPNFKPVTEQDFEEMMADLTDSLSGSESTQSTRSSASSADAVTSLLQKHTLNPKPIDPLAPTVPVLHKHSTHVWFTAPTLFPATVHLGIYKQVLPPDDNTAQALRRLQLPSIPRAQVNSKVTPAQGLAANTRIWTMIMAGGGHFAGAVVDVSKSHPQGLDKDKGVSVVAYKTFHRYTTRRKQGGAQSANDNSKGKARSAGAQIRRYNEAALEKDVHELLSQWRDWIHRSELVFIHAPSANKKLVYGYEGAVLSRDDPRVRSFPFSTKRPTLNELKRAFWELTTLKVSRLDETALQAHLDRLAQTEQAASASASLPSTTARATPTVAVTDPEPDKSTEKLILLAKQGKLDVLLSHLAKHPELSLYLTQLLPANSREENISHLPTLLHVAAHYGHPDLVRHLLVDAGADPTVTSTTGVHMAYDVAKDKETRNAFRRVMAEMPERWDWMQAHVPSALTKEMEEEQGRKEAEKKKKEREKKKKQNEERKEKEKEKKEQEPTQAQKGKQAAGPSIKGLMDVGSQLNTAHMTPEAKARLEREKRAKAAEMRFSKIGATAAGGSASTAVGGKCEMCGTSLEGKVPFERLDFKYCSTECVRKHREVVT